MLAGKTTKARRPEQALFQAPHLRQGLRVDKQPAAPSFRASDYSGGHQTSFSKSAGGPRYQQHGRPTFGAGFQDRAIQRSAAKFDQVRLISVNLINISRHFGDQDGEQGYQSPAVDQPHQAGFIGQPHGQLPPQHAALICKT